MAEGALRQPRAEEGLHQAIGRQGVRESFLGNCLLHARGRRDPAQKNSTITDHLRGRDSLLDSNTQGQGRISASEHTCRSTG